MHDNPNAPVPASGPPVTGVAPVPQDRPFYCYHHALVPCDAPQVVQDLLTWLEELDACTVLDPDSRTWLRKDPGRGYFRKVPGTAEQAARVFIAEAAASAKRAYDDGEPAWKGGDKWPFLKTWKLLTGQSDNPDNPTPAQLAQAMVDSAAGGERAVMTRKGLLAGESGRGMFLPWKVVIYNHYKGVPDSAWWSSEYDGCWDFGGDRLLTEMNLREIPFKAAGYIPDPDVPIDGFRKLLELVFPDPAAADAWLRSSSMCFTGIPTKEVLFWRGETNRGKSLLAALMSDLIGGYARNIPAKLLFGYATDDQRAAQELVGTWMAVVEEGVGNQSFKANEAFKAMSNGGALLNARQLYHESRMVPATHTLVLCANAEADPDFRDDAILARLVPIAFAGHPEKIVTYADTYNPTTEPGKSAWQREAPGVLALMLSYAQEFVAGWRPKTLLDLKKAGMLDGSVDDDLALAIEMQTGTNVGGWIADRRATLTGREWTGRELYSLYTQWCRGASFGQPDRGEVLTETKWGREIKNVPGVTFRRSNGARYTIS